MKIKKVHGFIVVLLLIIFSLLAYNLTALLPNQRRADEEINNLKAEIVKLQSELDKRKAISDNLQSELDETKGVTDALKAKLDEKKVFSDCDREAKDKSRELLAKKIEIAKEVNDPIIQQYQKAYDLGLHLKDDYNEYYENCLRRQGVKY